MNTCALSLALLFGIPLSARPALGDTIPVTNSVPVVSIQASDSSASEPGTNGGSFLIYRYGATNLPLTVYYEVGGTASKGIDYVLLPGSVSIPAGSVSATILVQPLDDSLPEPVESVILTLRPSPSGGTNNTAGSTNGPTYTLSSATSATVYIYDNDNQVPAVALVNPVEGANLTAGGNLLLQAEAHDADGTVAVVNFFQNGIYLGRGSVTTAGGGIFNFFWTNPPAGNFALTASAYDNFDTRSTSAPVHISIVAPVVSNAPPSVTLVAPVNGVTVTSPTNLILSAQASDSDGYVVSVEFFAGDLRLGVMNSTSVASNSAHGFYCVWTNPPEGHFSLTARATDNRGAQSVSAPVSVAVVLATNVPPSVHVTSPTNGAVLTAPANLYVTASASDPDDSVATVEFFLDGTGVGVTTNNPAAGTSVNPYRIVLNGLGTGQHVITAKATDTRGAARVSEPVTIVVKTNYVPPAVTLASPANGAVFYGPTNLILSASASDADGQVTQVDFYSGDSRIGSRTAAPYTLVWSNVLAGSYSLTARATDNSGLTTISPASKIVVRSWAELSFVKRSLPLWYVPGVKLSVRLQASPASNTVSYFISDSAPTGWTIGEAGTNGVVDASGQSIQFGPFNDGVSRTLSYTVIPPAGESGEKHFTGTGNLGGVGSPVLGVSAIVAAPAHPADLAPSDYSLTGNELGTYVSAWKQAGAWPVSPSPIPVSYVTRAGYLSVGGGGYALSTSYPTPFPPLLWVRPGGTGVSLNSPNGTAVEGAPWVTNIYSLGVSVMPTNYQPAVSFIVTISVTPRVTDSAYAIEERPPEGWKVSGISDDGFYSPLTRKINWGLFLDGRHRVLSYQVTPPTNRVSVVYFSGVVSVDGVNVPVAGTRQTRMASGVPGAAQLQSIVALPGGGQLITFVGSPGVAYQLEASLDFQNWTPMDQLLNNDGVLQYTDLARTNFVNRFYRAVPIEGLQR